MFDVTSALRATLLLTCSLRTSNGVGNSKVLTTKQFWEVNEFVSSKNASIGDLLTVESESLLTEAEKHFKELDIRELLQRGFQLAQALDSWASVGLWVLDTSNPLYPTKILNKTGRKCPPFLIGAGAVESLEGLALGVVGSRSADPTSLELSSHLGKWASEINVPIVSGGARGVDQTSMQGALNAGGRAIGIVSDSLAKLVVQEDARQWINEGHLIFVSVQDPFAPFSIGAAMQRNKYIYALSDVTIVVESDFERGGTWAGALEQIKTLNYSNVFIPESGSSKGLVELEKIGAKSCRVASSSDLMNLFKETVDKSKDVPPEQLTIF
jgi:predicted Rossmann fold nucleotide-binding protein DprA/Smf involved in DNA uptake